MKPAEHIQIVQEHLRLLNTEGHIRTVGREDGSCWHFWVQATQAVESLRTSILHRDSMKGDSHGMGNGT